MVLSYDYKDVEQEHGLAYGLGQMSMTNLLSNMVDINVKRY